MFIEIFMEFVIGEELKLYRARLCRLHGQVLPG